MDQDLTGATELVHDLVEGFDLLCRQDRVGHVEERSQRASRLVERLVQPRVERSADTLVQGEWACARTTCLGLAVALVDLLLGALPMDQALPRPPQPAHDLGTGLYVTI